jgi:hypothetical protein
MGSASNSKRLKHMSKIQYREFILIVTLGSLAADAHAQAVQPPLFAAFKSFCVNTGAGPDAVKPAVEMAGGKPLKEDATSTPIPMTLASWLITIDSHKMTVATVSSRVPMGHGKTAGTNQCNINSDANEDSSIAAIQQWVGVPPYRSSIDGQTVFTYYDYQEQGLARLPLPTDKAAVKSTMEAEHSWTLVVIKSQRMASISLTHMLAVNPAE